jgi:hypothetical protein
MASDWYKQKIMEPLIKGHVESGNYAINDAERNYLKAAGYTEDDFLNYVGPTTNGMTFGEYAIYQSNQGQKNALINNVDSNLQSSYNVIDQNVAAQKGILKNTYDTDVALLEADKAQRTADLDEAYEKNLQLVDTQRRLNERYLERKAAEMGSTNSGLNRTQLTANQLSAGNAMNDYGVQRQKAIDILNAAVQAQRLQMDTNYNNDLAALDMEAADQKARLQLDADNAKAQLEADYINNARTTYAQNQSNLYNQQVKAEERASSDRKAAYTDVYNIVKTLDRDDDIDRKSAAKIIEEFLMKYDPDGEFGYGNRLLALAGMTKQDFINLITSEDSHSTPWYKIDTKNLFKKRT